MVWGPEEVGRNTGGCGKLDPREEAFGDETKVSDARVRLKAVCEALEKPSRKAREERKARQGARVVKTS